MPSKSNSNASSKPTTPTNSELALAAINFSGTNPFTSVVNGPSFLEFAPSGIPALPSAALALSTTAPPNLSSAFVKSKIVGSINTMPKSTSSITNPCASSANSNVSDASTTPSPFTSPYQTSSTSMGASAAVNNTYWPSISSPSPSSTGASQDTSPSWFRSVQYGPLLPIYTCTSLAPICCVATSNPSINPRFRTSPSLAKCTGKLASPTISWKSAIKSCKNCGIFAGIPDPKFTVSVGPSSYDIPPDTWIKSPICSTAYSIEAPMRWLPSKSIRIGVPPAGIEYTPSPNPGALSKLF